MRLPGPGFGQLRSKFGVVAATVAIVMGPGRAAVATPDTDHYTNAGIIGLTITNLGFIGNGFDRDNRRPSCEYPLNSHVEHLFLGGLWVGAVTSDGSVRVSTGAQDAATLIDGDNIREFQDTQHDTVVVWSNSQNSDHYNAQALATQHFQATFDDYAQPLSGNHVPMGLKVVLRALAWSNPYADDFVILDYAIVNISESALRDVYLGLWADTTVGNTEHTNPYDPQATVKWNWYDDVNGAWGPSGAVADSLGLPPGLVPGNCQVAQDPGIWMTHERDDDGDEGLATSWVGCRLLGTNPLVLLRPDTAPVSYNAWRFRGVPAQDDWYVDQADGQTRPGKYQLMSNGAFTVGETPDFNYDTASDWVSLLATGPIPFMAPGDTLHITYAMVCGADSLSLLANSKVAQVAYDDGFSLPSGPPSPRLEVGYEWNTIKLGWAPGDSLDADTGEPRSPDDPARSPEHHISTITGKPDFQGYRIYRYQGATMDQDPYAISTLVAEFDKIDGFGFDTGLPPLNERGQREFVDPNLLDGFPYWYSVVAFSAPDREEGLPSFQSGFNENAVLVYPGSAARPDAAAGQVGVVPNPYRGGSQFDNPRVERELSRKIWFTNLPARSTIKVFTVAGDLVRTLHHDDPLNGKHEWDVLSEYGRAIASGLYVYVVENLDTGEVQRGKLVILK